ncbi:hypothetical protein OJ997_27765 [Solirubrobacter phytolaccae]|uniref:Acyl-CoA dehydrogenase n=1 Tax=Solirubrobacter phytolaccae TaxID=1404360 RepID=A0A9X3ND00_9ACTN|nr:hypothetical protein [Solirubrobacter phytolaccae]MDA0184138.1 hypothetical protein [Solirubrobacter phytolaccae]
MPSVLSVSPVLPAAERLAAHWRRGALDRDRDPWVQDGALEALAASGLLGACAGASGPAIADLVRILATGDPGLAQQLHGHVGNVELLALASPAVREAISDDIRDRGARFGNLNRDADPRRPTTLTPDGDGFRLTGAKSYCTGAVDAQWLAVPALLGDELRVALVPAGADGIEVGTRWEAFGQRATRSVGVTLTDVAVPRDHVLDAWRDAPAAQARELRAQIPHPALEVGIAEAVLAESWPAHVRESDAFAAVTAHVAAARALLDDAAAQIDALAPRTAAPRNGLGAPRNDADASGEAALTVAPSRLALGEASLALFAARALSYRTSVRTADAATRWVGGDARLAARVELHWRNARTHSVHDPGRWAFHHVGRHVLTGAYPAPRSPGLKHRADELVAPPRLPSFVPTGHVVADAARAALAEAAQFVAQRSAWPEAGVARAVDEPHAILRFGELAVRLRALDALDARGEGARYADEVALRIVSDALEIAGASALTRGRGLDEHWRTIANISNPIKFM